MVTAKEHISQIINRQPDDSSYDDIVRELAFDLMVQRGLSDADEGNTIPNEEMKHRIRTWQEQLARECVEYAEGVG
jgi:predicted transcriptional regulator